MSLKEIIKRELPISNQSFSKLTTKNTHCQNKCYQFCNECKNYQNKICNEKIVFKNVKQVQKNRWHLYFNCQNNHFIIKYVILDSNSIIIGNLKN